MVEDQSGETCAGGEDGGGCILAAGLGHVGDEFALGVGDLLVVTGFATREGASNEQIVGLADLEPVHDASSTSR
jgi:hypothetical protein